jgi:hypothetical protein
VVTWLHTYLARYLCQPGTTRDNSDNSDNKIILGTKTARMADEDYGDDDAFYYDDDDYLYVEDDYAIAVSYSSSSPPVPTQPSVFPSCPKKPAPRFRESACVARFPVSGFGLVGGWTFGGSRTIP